MAAAPHEATLVFSYPDAATARTVERSVRREVDEIDGDRSRATVDRDVDTVTVTVAARDLTALRAGQNTWLTLVEVAERTAAAGARFRST